MKKGLGKSETKKAFGKKIKSLIKQKKRHMGLISEHRDVKGKKHTIGYWQKEILRFDEQIDESRRILKRKKRR